MTEQTWFPGLDFPDREEWLKIRSTPQRKPRGTVIYSGKKPLNLGINLRKRQEAFTLRRAHGRYPKHGPMPCIIASRHRYYAEAAR